MNIENIPDSWSCAILSDISEVVYGKGLPERERRTGDFPVVSSAGIVGFHSEYLIKGPIIVTGRKGTIGKTYYIELDSWVIDTAYGLKPNNEMSAKYLYWLLNSIKIEDLHSSTAIPSLSRESLYQLNIPIPPIAEQIRIVKKVETTFEKIEVIEKQLNQISELTGKASDPKGLIQKLKNSILSKAFEGRLVEQNTNEGTGHELLEKILKSKDNISSKKISEKIKPDKKAKSDKQTKK